MVQLEVPEKETITPSRIVITVAEDGKASLKFTNVDMHAAIHHLHRAFEELSAIHEKRHAPGTEHGCFFCPRLEPAAAPVDANLMGTLVTRKDWETAE